MNSLDEPADTCGGKRTLKESLGDCGRLISVRTPIVESHGRVVSMREKWRRRVFGLLVGALCCAPEAAWGVAIDHQPEPRVLRTMPIVASVVDAPNDVKLRRLTGGLSKSERTSIDVRALEIRVSADFVRFSIQIKKLELPASRRFEQMIFIELAPPDGVSSEWSGNIGLSPQRASLSYAYFNYGASLTAYESCDPIRAAVSPRKQKVRLDVPRRCLPAAPAQIGLTSMTGYFRSDAGGPWSTDTVRIENLDLRQP